MHGHTHLLADKGFNSDAFRGNPTAQGLRPMIPTRPYRKAGIRWNRHIYKEQTRIKLMIRHLKINRAVPTRYENLSQTFLDTFHFATIRRSLRLATEIGADLRLYLNFLFWPEIKAQAVSLLSPRKCPYAISAKIYKI